MDHPPNLACTHKQVQHRHGTNVCYVADKCRCDLCASAARLYNKRLRLNDLAGIAAYVDAEPARVHVQQLMAAGLGPKLLAQRSGVPHGAISKLIYGDYGRHTPPSRRIRQATADKLLAVTAGPAVLGDRKAVDSAVTLRRLQALVWAGWSISELGRQLGMNNPTNLHRIMRNPVVGAGTHRRVEALFNRLWGVAPPQDTHRQRIAFTRARRYARVRGWQGFGDLDDYTDDVDDALDEVTIERLLAGEPCTPTDAELAEAARLLTARGWSQTAIRRHLHPRQRLAS